MRSVLPTLMVLAAVLLSLWAQPSGAPVLAVKYRWAVHARPSVEVRLLTEDERDIPQVQPLAFVDQFMRGKVELDVYRVQDRAESVPFSLAFTKQDTDFELLGRRNALSKAAVCAVTQTRVGRQKGAIATFVLLDSWAADERTLLLDLPEDYFANPGRLRVWFLRGADVVWSEGLAWPGISRPSAPAKPQAR